MLRKEPLLQGPVGVSFVISRIHSRNHAPLELTSTAPNLSTTATVRLDGPPTVNIGRRQGGSPTAEAGHRRGATPTVKIRRRQGGPPTVTAGHRQGGTAITERYWYLTVMAMGLLRGTAELSSSDRQWKCSADHYEVEALLCV